MASWWYLPIPNPKDAFMMGSDCYRYCWCCSYMPAAAAEAADATNATTATGTAMNKFAADAANPTETA